jgi:hypothetical protein
MGETFDVGLLRQVTAPQGKLSISKYHVRPDKNIRRDQHKKGGGGFMREPSLDERGRLTDPGAEGGEAGKIDITI